MICHPLKIGFVRGQQEQAVAMSMYERLAE